MGSSVVHIVLALLINSIMCSYSPTGINVENYEIVFPKLYTSTVRRKRDLSSHFYQESDTNVTVLELNNWIIEYSKNPALHFAQNYSVEILSEHSNESIRTQPDCEFLSGYIHGIESQSSIMVCNDQVRGFVNIGYDLFFVEPLNSSSQAHVLYHSDLLKRRNKRDNNLGSVCFTSEFYNLTGDAENDSADDDIIIELDADEVEDNGGNLDETPYNTKFADGEIDETGYFFDSAWEAHPFKKRKSSKITAPRRWLEIAIGVDYSVINFHGKNKVQHYILALMNIVSAIYQDPSLEANLELVLTRMILYDHKRYGQVREGNARKSLENVNSWNKKLHNTLTAGEPRHDLAVWLTRVNIGGPSGYAPVSGVCDPNRSCTLNRDEGLTSAFIIAHEMAHVLGLTHDGDKKAHNSCDQEALDGSVMAPMVAATFHKFSWSSCSKKEFHRRAIQWRCLKNSPPGKGEVILKPTLHASFSMDEQCRMEFGDGFQLCRTLDIMEPCAHLWCGHVDTPLVCKTKKGPPLEGTICGLNKYCINGYCESDTFGYQLEPVAHNPQDGGWGNWSNWGSCSRSCGFGAQFRSRFCDNPPTAYGGNYCKGQHEEYQICGEQTCQEPLVDLRAEQCSLLTKLIEIKDPAKQNMTWLPYEAEKKSQKCQLICISKQTGEILLSGENLLDGTPCSYDQDSDICVQGICQNLGCDGSPKSSTHEDSCGTCAGNQSECKNMTTDFQRNIKREMSRIRVIPRLARNILIECSISAARKQNFNSVFLMMRDRRKGIRYNLTTTTEVSRTNFVIRGAKFHFSKHRNHFKLWARGPILDEIILYLYAPPTVVNSGIGMAIKSSYSIRKDMIRVKGINNARYVWIVGGLGPCSASCGGGKRQRTIACRDTIHGRIVTRRHCPLTQKPAIITEECNTFSCRFHWIPGEWEHCTATCGSNGIQDREIYCVHHTINTLIPTTNKSSGSVRNTIITSRQIWKDAVSPDRCPKLRLETQRSCNRIPCTAYWEPTDWSECSTSCGVGVSIRDFQCPPPKGESFYSCGIKPEEQRRKCRGLYTRRTNPFCKGQRRRACTKDESKLCTLTDYFAKYCVLSEFRKVCCKSCSNHRKHTS